MVNLFDWNFDFLKNSAKTNEDEASDEASLNRNVESEIEQFAQESSNQFELVVDKLELENKLVLKTSKEIEEENKDHVASLNYASIIQNAIIHKKERIEKVLPESFILNMPLNIVSGDFVRVETKQNKILVALADCTGHGIPGAMMSMIGCALLCEVINSKNVVYPPAVLQLLDASFMELTSGSNSINDGMDIGLCSIDYKKMELNYCGAHRPLYHIRNGNLTEIKSDNLSIGGSFQEEKEFKNRTLRLCKNDRIYMFSDGYTDQFGEVSGKKFSSKRLKNLLLSIQHLNMEEQENCLKKAIIEWKGASDQTDDICILGITI